MMKIVTQRSIILAFRDRWNEQYKDRDDDWTFFDGKRIGDVRRQIAALDLETCSPEDIAAIASASWSDNSCDECLQSVPVLLQIGQEPDWEARWVDLCPDCLSKASKMLRKAVRAK